MNVFNDKPFGGPTPLEEVRQKFNIGVTLNVPRTKAFIRADSLKQKVILHSILSESINQVSKKYIVKYDYYYETCQDGNVHLHGLITSNTIQSPVLFIMDLDRRLRITINKCMKVNKPYLNVYNDTYKRIRKAAYCLQVLKDEAEYDRWVTYMLKEQQEPQAHELE